MVFLVYTKVNNLEKNERCRYISTHTEANKPFVPEASIPTGSSDLMGYSPLQETVTRLIVT